MSYCVHREKKKTQELRNDAEKNTFIATADSKKQALELQSFFI